MSIVKSVLLFFTFCSLLILWGCQQPSVQPSVPNNSVQFSVPSKQDYQRTYRQSEQDGILLASDYERLVSISESITKTQTLSDEDVDFWITLVKKGPLVKDPMKQLRFEAITFGLIIEKKKLSPEQKKKLFAVIVPYTADRQINLPGDIDPTMQEELIRSRQTNNLRLLASVDAEKALPVMKQVSEQSANEKVREEAATLYKKLQEKLNP